MKKHRHLEVEVMARAIRVGSAVAPIRALVGAVGVSPTVVRLGVALFLAFLAPVLGWAQESEVTKIKRLFLDESDIVPVENVKRVSITNPRIADVVVIGPKELRLDGLSRGRTTLYIWDGKGRQRWELVVYDRRDDLAQVIREAINLPEVVVQVVNGQVLMRGWLENDNERRVATEIARLYGPGTITDLMQVRGQRASGVEDQIKRILNLPEVKVTIIYDPADQQRVATSGNPNATPKINTILLEGFVDDQRDFDRAEVIARAYAGNVRNLTEITRPIQVQVQAHLLELSVNDATLYGFNWGTVQVTGSPGGPIAVNGATSGKQVRLLENVFQGPHGQGTFFGAKTDVKNNFPWEFENINRLDPLFATVNWLMTQGKGRILANPKVVTRAGSKANINVGGQIVYPLVSATGTPTTGFQPFGIVMDITPEVDHKGNINTKLLVNVSNPDIALGAQVGASVVPGLRTRTTASEVSVKDGEHIIVSGLLSDNQSKLYDKTPYLHKLPIVGNLFQSKRYQVDKTELVVIVTPNLVATREQEELRVAKDAKDARDARAAKASKDTKASQDVSITSAKAAGSNGSGRPQVTEGTRMMRSSVGATADYSGPHRGGADPKHMSEWAANKTAAGLAVGTVPVRPGLPPRPLVPTLPEGDTTARGRVQALLAGMREQLNYSERQDEMDRPASPPEPAVLHQGASGRFPRRGDPYNTTSYDSVTPREALRREAAANRIVPTRSISSSSATDGAQHGAAIVGASDVDQLQEEETMTDDELEARLAGGSSRSAKASKARSSKGAVSEDDFLEPGSTKGSASTLVKDMDRAFDQMKEQVRDDNGPTSKGKNGAGKL